MIIYKDIFNGDEVLSDSYKIEDTGFLLKVVAKMKSESSAIDDRLIGGNPSAEDTDTAGADDTESVKLDVVSAHKLVETGFTKKDYQTYIKGYMKRLKEKLKEKDPALAAEFEEKAKAEMKAVMDEFKEYQFFMGESMDPEGHIILVKSIDAQSAECIYFKYGLEKEKF